MSEVRARRAVHALRSQLRLTPQQAEFVMRLYEAAGQPVDNRDMDDALTPHWTQPRKSGLEYVSTVACHVRKKLGTDAIENNHCAYSLTAEGMRKISELLSIGARPEPGT